MKKSITFIHPSRYQRVEVRVGPDPLLLLAGAVALSLHAWAALWGETVHWGWLAGGAVLAHARLWRHALTLPMAASVTLALMSGGMSMAITAVAVNKLVAQRYRHAGWKIRNTDGELGEYSSRFLAVDKLGFHERDLMANVVGKHLDEGLIDVRDDYTPVTPLPARAPAAAAPARTPDRPYIVL
ncbi:hypothetical protein [Sphaerotilus sp.]|uniref:hypothetical protein n=1 Tax=Sphaerotilus sp. TaxID=2093942 RepID=UPI002ACEFDED|nr:hypothetical protein [Sphaerotilus sp.]MDZ7856458.1 hypothetical protein [Sphaerotilus sp.]